MTVPLKQKKERIKDMENTDSVIISKVQKLLALGTNNSNENEAQAAILKAHEIMAKFGIDAICSDEQKILYSTEYCEHKGNRKFRKSLAYVIAPNFRCHHYLYNGCVTFFGHSNDAKIAKESFEYAYDFAYKQSNRLYAEYRRNEFNAQGILNSYALGFICGLKEKLDAQSTSLLVITPTDVHNEYADVKKKLGLRISTTRLSASKHNRTVYNRGLADGRTVMNGRKLKSAG